MLPLLSIFFSSFIIALSGAMMPGPLLTVTISESSRRGAITGPLLITGHAILEFILIIGLLIGIEPVLKHELFFITIALTGGIIILWMAWGMFRSLPILSVNREAKTGKKNNLLLSGILLSIANPYWIIWWATIGIGYIAYTRELGLADIFIFFIGHIAGDFIWYTAISLAVSKGKKLFTDRIYRIIIAVCAVFLSCFAIYLVITAVIKII